MRFKYVDTVFLYGIVTYIYVIRMLVYQFVIQ